MSAALNELGVQHCNEKLLGKALLVDVYVEANGLVIEVDGPSHFVLPLDGGASVLLANVPTQMKRRLLHTAGFQVLALSFLELDGMSDEALIVLLTRRLRACGDRKPSHGGA